MPENRSTLSMGCISYGGFLILSSSSMLQKQRSDAPIYDSQWSTKQRYLFVLHQYLTALVECVAKNASE